MLPDDPADGSTWFRRYLLGIGVLVLTVVFANMPMLVRHPELLFDVPRAGTWVLRVMLVGYGLMAVTGLYLALSLIFDFTPWRRVAVFLWPLALALYFLPLPAPRDDLALAPALLLASVLLAWLCLEVDRSTRPAS